MWTLLLTSLVGGGLATLIVAMASAAIAGRLSVNDIIVALLVGLGSGVGLCFAFRNRLGKKSCLASRLRYRQVAKMNTLHLTGFRQPSYGQEIG